MKKMVVFALVIPLVIAGCAAKKPVNYKYQGCRVTNTWTDQDGNQRKDCTCVNGKVIGIDTKTGARIVKCN